MAEGTRWTDVGPVWVLIGKELGSCFHLRGPIGRVTFQRGVLGCPLGSSHLVITHVVGSLSSVPPRLPVDPSMQGVAT